MSRLSKESLDLNKRIEDQDRSESVYLHSHGYPLTPLWAQELHVMYQQVKSEYGKQLEETEDLRGRAEEQRMVMEGKSMVLHLGSCRPLLMLRRSSRSLLNLWRISEPLWMGRRPR